MHSRGCMKHRLPQLRSKHPDLGRVRALLGNSAGSSTYRSLIAYLLKTRPVAFWSGVWTSIFLVSLVALGCLLSPSASSNRTPAEIAADAQSDGETVPPQQQEGQIPIGMFGAIVLTCAAGSLLVARYLKLSPPVASKGGKRTSRALRPVSKPVSPAQAGYREPSRQLQTFSPTAPLPFPVPPTFTQSPSSPVVLTPTVQPPELTITQQQSQQEQPVHDLIAWLNSELEQPSYSLENPLDPFTASVDSVNQSMMATGTPTEDSPSLNWGQHKVVNTVNGHRLRSLQAWLADS